MTFIEKHMEHSLKDHVLEQVLDTEKFKGFYLKPPGRTRMMSTLILFTPEGIIICGDLCPGNRGANRGNVSAFGYALDWFASKLGEDYLCSKFLDKDWHEELAVRDLDRMAKEILRGGYDDDYGKELSRASEERRAAFDDLLHFRRDLKEVTDAEDIANVKASIARVKEELKPLREAVVSKRRGLADKFLELAHDCDHNCHEQVSFVTAYREMTQDYDIEWVPGWGYGPAEAGWLCAIQQKFAELYNAPKPVPE